MPVDRFTLAQLRGARLFFLVDIHWGGRVVRLSTMDLVVPDADNSRQLHYAGVLDELQLADGLQYLESNIGQASLPMECVLPFDGAAYRAAGHRLEWAKAEVSRWIQGTDYDDRQRRLVGRVKDPEIGANRETSAWSIEENVWEDAALIPDERQRVNKHTWSATIDTLLDEELGLYYPIVFGYPGRTPKGSNGAWVTGSQGVWVDHQGISDGSGGKKNLRLVIAGHSVQATRVMLNTDETPTGERFIVQEGRDDRGHVVSYVDAWSDPTETLHELTDADSETAYGLGAGPLTGDFQPIRTELKPIFVGWYVPDASGEVSGGMVGPGGKVVREAGDVLETALSYTTVLVDRGRLAAAKPGLRPFLIDCVIDEQVKPWEWVQSNLLPLLPISWASGPDGVYPIVMRFDATAADAVCHLDADADPRISRASRIVVDSSKIINDLTLEYAYSVRTGNHQATIRVHGGAFDLHDPDAHPNLCCRLSQQRYQNPDGTPYVAEEKLQSVCIYDPASAAAVVAWRARAFALAQERIDYQAPEFAFGWLERGAVVTITDREMGLSRRVALVEEIQSDDSGVMGLKLLLLEDPLRELKPAA